MRARVARARVARLATIAPDGRPRLVPCTFVLAGECVYSAVDHKPKRTTELARLADVRADPRVTLLVDEYDDADWSRLWWVRVRGRGRVLDGGAEHDAAIGALVEKYPAYRARPPSGPVLAVDVDEWSGWSARA